MRAHAYACKTASASALDDAGRGSQGKVKEIRKINLRTLKEIPQQGSSDSLPTRALSITLPLDLARIDRRFEAASLVQLRNDIISGVPPCEITERKLQKTQTDPCPPVQASIILQISKKALTRALVLSILR